MARSCLAWVLLLGGVGCGAHASVQATDKPAETTDLEPSAECVAGAGQACSTESARSGGPSAHEPSVRAPSVPTLGALPADPQDPPPIAAARAPSVPADPKDPRTVADSALSGERSAWHAHAPAEYVFASCGTGAVAPECSLHAVQHGMIVASETRSYQTHEWTVYESSETEDPIDALFDDLERSIDGCRATHELAADYAYPSRIYHDCGEEGWGIDVVCFEAGTLDVEECRARVR